MELKLKLKIKDIEFELTEEEARELYNSLDNIYGNEKAIYPIYPINPIVIPNYPPYSPWYVSTT